MPTIGITLTFLLGGIAGFNPYSTDSDKNNAYFTIECVVLATAILPFVVTVILKKLKLISSLHMPLKEERTLPFLITGLLYYSMIHLFSQTWKIPLPILIYQFMIGATLAIIIGMIITYSWKISIHMIGIGGVVGILITLSKTGNNVLFFPIIISIFVSGIIGFSRLELKAHNPGQLIAGFILGFACETLGLFIN